MDTTITDSPFSGPVRSNPAVQWSKWEAHKHLVYTICRTVADIAETPDPRASLSTAVEMLASAITLHDRICAMRAVLADCTGDYQAPWRAAAQELLSDESMDFDYLALLSDSMRPT